MAMLLALDLGATTGWAAGDSAAVLAAHDLSTMAPRAQAPGITCGTWRIGSALDDGAMLEALHRHLTDALTAIGPRQVWIETTFIARDSKIAISPIMSQIKRVGLTEWICQRREVECRTGSPATGRKALTGKPRRDNAAVMAACRRMGCAPRNNHEADALALLLNAARQWRPARRKAA